MTKKRFTLVALLCLLALAVPQIAEARAGGGSRSQGSRGSRTYQTMPSSPYQARPMERSTTQQQNAPRPEPGFAPQAAPSAAPSFFQRHPVLTSLGAGLLGAGLFSALFGHDSLAAAHGAAGAGSGFGSLLQILLLGGLAFLAFRWFRNRQTAQQGASPFAPGGMDAPFANLTPSLPFGGSAAPQAQQGTPLTLTDADYQAFQSLHEKIQLAWGQADMTSLRPWLTSEMQHYFSEELAANTSRGTVNKVEQVKLLSGDLIEAWSEGEMDYATVHMRWSALDYKARLDRQPIDPDYVAEGNPTQPTEAEEIWTFTRVRGGNWVLSAIQQVG